MFGIVLTHLLIMSFRTPFDIQGIYHRAMKVALESARSHRKQLVIRLVIKYLVQPDFSHRVEMTIVSLVACAL